MNDKDKNIAVILGTIGFIAIFLLLVCSANNNTTVDAPVVNNTTPVVNNPAPVV
jgi:hypothetical protein